MNWWSRQAQRYGSDSETGITAAGNDSQADGYSITAAINEVTTVTATNNTVTLPPLANTDGRVFYVFNFDSADTLNVYPASGESIDDLAVNTKITVLPDAGTALIPLENNKWLSFNYPVGSGSIDHGSLAGLADDDHAQYLRKDGTRALTANWDAGNYRITSAAFTSDVATGTAPFVVASTTKVTNLNADTVDGIDGATSLSLDAGQYMVAQGVNDDTKNSTSYSAMSSTTFSITPRTGQAVWIHFDGHFVITPTAATDIYLKLERGVSTLIREVRQYFHLINAERISFDVIDFSPGTSATTYNLYWKLGSVAGSQVAYVYDRCLCGACFYYVAP